MTYTNTSSKLNREQVEDIIQRLLDGETSNDIAKLHSVHRSTIIDIANKRSHKQYTIDIIFEKFNKRQNVNLKEKEVVKIINIFVKNPTKETVKTLVEATGKTERTIHDLLFRKTWKDILPEVIIDTSKLIHIAEKYKPNGNKVFSQPKKELPVPKEELVKIKTILKEGLATRKEVANAYKFDEKLLNSFKTKKGSK